MLLDMCKTTELIILNGRCGEDKYLGATTCNNSSVIDYALVNYGCLDNFHINFKVHEFSHLLSDVHNQISISLSPIINISHLSPSKYPELSDQSPGARETVTNKSKPITPNSSHFTPDRFSYAFNRAQMESPSLNTDEAQNKFTDITNNRPRPWAHDPNTAK
ncbi:zinc-binding alcohol dehydrogenase domain-containing protein 2, partial [Elysia marginata]